MQILFSNVLILLSVVESSSFRTLMFIIPYFAHIPKNSNLSLMFCQPLPLVFGNDILGWGLEILESPQRIAWLSHRSAGCHGNTSSSVSVWCFWGTSKSQCLVALTHIEQHGATWPAMHQRGKLVCYCLWFLTAFSVEERCWDREIVLLQENLNLKQK